MVGFLHPNVFDDASESLRLGRGPKVGKRSILGRPSSKFRHNSNRWRLIGQCSTKVAIGDLQWPASHFKRGCIDVSHVTVRSAIFNRLRKKIALIKETENILLLAFVLASHFPFLLQLYLVVDYVGGVPDGLDNSQTGNLLFTERFSLRRDANIRRHHEWWNKHLPGKNGGFGHCVAFVVLV